MMKIREGIGRWIQQLDLTIEEKKRSLILIIGTIILTVLILILDNQPLEGSLYRNTYGEGDREEQLFVQIESEDSQRFAVEVEVDELIYTEEECKKAFDTCIEDLDKQLLGKNKSADQVYYDLEFIRETNNEAISVEWRWSPYEVLDYEGKIQEEYVEEEGTLVEVTAILMYGEEEVKHVQNFLIKPEPKEGMDVIIDQLLKKVEFENCRNLTEQEMQLPQIVSGHSVTWYKPISYRGMGMLLIGLGIMVTLIWKKQEDKKQQKEAKREQMLTDFTQIIYTLTLYIGAGMTVKNAWKRMVSEYIQRIEMHGESIRYAYEEMKIVYYEMSNGISEVECYEQFGRRCNLRCYQRLGLLLSQNVRKGTKGLTQILERETIEAFEERKNRAKQEGEKAGTKVLMPMFLMLAVVLVIIIVPAFLSIQV